jgi:hypothetical protein
MRRTADAELFNPIHSTGLSSSFGFVSTIFLSFLFAKRDRLTCWRVHPSRSPSLPPSLPLPLPLPLSLSLSKILCS